MGLCFGDCGERVWGCVLVIVGREYGVTLWGESMGLCYGDFGESGVLRPSRPATQVGVRVRVRVGVRFRVRVRVRVG